MRLQPDQMQAARNKMYKIDSLSIALLAMTIVVFVFVNLGMLMIENQALYNISLFMIILGFVGLFLNLATNFSTARYRFLDINRKELMRGFMWGAIGFVMIMIVSWFIIPALFGSMSALSFEGSVDKLVTVLIAINEEFFFRAFVFVFMMHQITPIIMALRKNNIQTEENEIVSFLISASISALIFSFFHIYAYGLTISSMLYIFSGGFIMAFVYWRSRVLISPIITHLVNNILVVVMV